MKAGIRLFGVEVIGITTGDDAGGTKQLKDMANGFMASILGKQSTSPVVEVKSIEVKEQ